jgi:electron transfer flavoprotein alpha subunit
MKEKIKCGSIIDHMKWFHDKKKVTTIESYEAIIDALQASYNIVRDAWTITNETQSGDNFKITVSAPLDGDDTPDVLELEFRNRTIAEEWKQSFDTKGEEETRKQTEAEKAAAKRKQDVRKEKAAARIQSLVRQHQARKVVQKMKQAKLQEEIKNLQNENKKLQDEIVILQRKLEDLKKSLGSDSA